MRGHTVGAREGPARAGKPYGSVAGVRRQVSGPKACGSTSRIGSTPSGVSSGHLGPPFSHSSWRHRPHGIRGSPSADAGDGEEPPAAGRVQLGHHAALRAQGHAVGGVLDVAPCTTRPSSTSPATPTRKWE